MITKKEVDNIALLAKLSVKEDEYSRLLSDLQQMIGFADMVRCGEVCDSDLSCAQVKEEAFYKDDEVSPSFSREQILSNAPVCDEEFFVVRKRA